jgi:hypothetical protein
MRKMFTIFLHRWQQKFVRQAVWQRVRQAVLQVTALLEYNELFNISDPDTWSQRADGYINVLLDTGAYKNKYDAHFNFLAYEFFFQKGFLT